MKLEVIAVHAGLWIGQKPEKDEGVYTELAFHEENGNRVIVKMTDTATLELLTLLLGQVYERAGLIPEELKKLLAENKKRPLPPPPLSDISKIPQANK